MFDVGLSEILIIAVVALIVIGPEKLPKTARTLGHLFGRLQRYVADVKADINREMELDELRKLQQQVQSASKDIEQSVSSAVQDVETGVRSVQSELDAAATDAPADVAKPVTDLLAEPAAEPAPAPVAAPVLAGAPAAEPARQSSLPGFERG
ncbi:MAG: Sec-independent protein translocase protein TatB [Betaproteobacteria bacterium]